MNSPNPQELQDVLACLLLSEAVYKAAEGPPTAAVAALNRLLRQLPTGAPTPPPLEAVQFCRRAAPHRYLLARGGGALYVAFMGTKQPRDYLSDANLLTSALLWGGEGGLSAPKAGPTPAAGNGASGRATATATAPVAAASDQAAEGGAVTAGRGQVAAAAALAAPAAHRGFLGRAQGVPVEALYVHARQQGLRLVLCGHSMGGAVAQICMLRLLHVLRRNPPPASALRCIAFGTPAIGNAALAAHVQQQGWGAHFMSIALPEDPIPRLFLQAPASQQQAALPQVLSEVEEEEEGEQLAQELGSAAAAAAMQAGLRGRSGTTTASSQLSRTPQAAAAATAAPAGAGRGAGAGAGAGAPATAPSPWRPAAAAVAALAQRPLAAAGGAAMSVARSARAGAAMLRPPPLLPAFAHIGELYHLLPDGLMPATGSTAVAAPQPAPGGDSPPQNDGGSANLPAQQRWQLQQWRHSMQHYRARSAGLSWQQPQGVERPEGSSGAVPAGAAAQGTQPAEVALTRTLAPAVVVHQATASLPVLPLPSAFTQRMPAPRQQLVPLSVSVHGRGLECCTGALLRLPGTAAPQPAVLLTNRSRQQLLLDLEAEGGGDSAHGGTGSNSISSSSAAGWLKAAAERGWAGVQQRLRWRQQQAGAQQGQPGLLLQFAVPAAAILTLQAQQHAQQQEADRSSAQQGPAALLLPPARLFLLSDFGRVHASVQLRPQVAWLLGLDASLAASAFEQLQAAAAGGAAVGAAAAQQQGRQRQQQQQQWQLAARVAAPLRGLAAAASSGAAAANSRLSSAMLWRASGGAGAAGTAGAAGLGGAAGTAGAAGPEGAAGLVATAADEACLATADDAGTAPAEQPQQAEEEQHLGWSSLGRLRQRYAEPAAQRLVHLRQQLAARLPLQQRGGAPHPELPAALLRGLLLLDTTPALCAAGSSAEERLEAAAEALRWVGTELQQQRAAGAAAVAAGGAESRGGAKADAEAGAGPDAELETEDEYLAELRHLGMAAQLRRQLARTARAAASHAVRQRWRRAVRAAPPPDAVLLLLHHRQLLSSTYGEGLDEAVLSAVRRVAAACRACGAGVPLLLAVASQAPLSGPYRQQLAASCGLLDGSGSTGGAGGTGGSSSVTGSAAVLQLLPHGPHLQATPGGSASSSSWGLGAAGQAAGEHGGGGSLHVDSLLAALLAVGAASASAALSTPAGPHSKL